MRRARDSYVLGESNVIPDFLLGGEGVSVKGHVYSKKATGKVAKIPIGQCKARVQHALKGPKVLVSAPSQDLARTEEKKGPAWCWQKR